jgi:phosphatidylserine decarboxylase
MMKQNRWPIAIEGLPFLIPAVLLTILFGMLGWRVWVYFGIFLSTFLAYFFRNPKRKIPDLQNVILSPADGRIVYVGECEEERFLKQKTLKVSIFMSLFDVHLNRTPISGKVVERNYIPGRFLVASLEKSSLLNEQNAMILESEDRFKILLVQIAGFVARRIVCYAKEGDSMRKGEIFGLIRFGSRVDLYLPIVVKSIVRVGQHVKGGESIIGYRA